MKEKNRKIHYICYYCDECVKDEYVCYPSVLSKIEYVINTIKDAGYKLNIVSTVCPQKKFFQRKRIIRISPNENHIYLLSLTSRKKVYSYINRVLRHIQIVLYCLNVPKQDVILVYHSLAYCTPLKILKTFFKRKYILEIEDIYSSVNDFDKKHTQKEWSSFHFADAYLSVNDIIAQKLDKNKDVVLSYGRYELPEQIENKTNDKIRLIYAGVIEHVREAAFLAIETMRYLSENFELYICGFGNDEDINDLNDKILEINSTAGRKVIDYLGYKTGKEYEQILQSCDIALSTHMYNKENMESADYTFPSKMLVYLSNGLRIVAQDLDVLKKSSIGDLIYYYDIPDAKCIAETIKNIDLNSVYDARKRIEKLDCEFKIELKNLIERMDKDA